MTPSSMSTSYPDSPSRDTPNTHPYTIKTSSSALLTRSNSTGNRNNINHHYAPLSPSKDGLAAKQSRYMQSHRLTKSLSSDMDANPSPMPVPPSASVPVRLANQLYINGGQAIVSDGEGIPPTPPITWRIKRSDTLPSMFPNKSDTNISVQDLPNNPKTWTPSQLSVYLSSALRLKGGVRLPVPVAHDIATFVLKEHLSGRAFLRMKKEDYDDLGINQLWKDALLDASRALRQNVVQGRVMGFGSASTLSTLSAHDMLLPQGENAAAMDLPAYSALDPTHRRLPSSTPQWEEDKRRMSKTSFRAGRVRGMVETYERSFSESSASGSDCDDHEDNPAKILRLDARELVHDPEGDEGGFASGEMTSGSEDEAGNAIVSGRCFNGGASAGLLLSPTSSPEVDAGNLITPPVQPSEDSPSIEALLREQEQNGTEAKQYQSWGAKAWEDETDDPNGLHATAKRVPTGELATAKMLQLPKSSGTVLRVSTLPTKGLADLFAQREVKEVCTSGTSTDASVGIGEEVQKGDERASGQTVSETLEAFHRRLEVVEQRLDEMDRKDQEREADKWVEADTEVECRYQDDLEGVPIKYRGEALRRRLPRASHVLYPEEPKGKNGQIKNYTGTDPSLLGLPRYMFLISLGVVAVTMRVMLRRMVGGRKRT